MYEMKKYCKRYQQICQKRNKPNLRMQIIKTCFQLDILDGLVFKLKLVFFPFSENKTKCLLLLSYCMKVDLQTPNESKFKVNKQM